MQRSRWLVYFLFLLSSLETGCGEDSDSDMLLSPRGGEGPLVRVLSNIAGRWNSAEPYAIRDVFVGEGFHFTWSATPQAGEEIAGYSYAWNDSSTWSAFSLETVDFPAQIPGDPEELYVPSPGNNGLYVRAIDTAGAIRILTASLRVFSGPRACPEEDRFILAVLDTDPNSLIDDGIWPRHYRVVERELVQFLFAGYAFQVHETYGSDPPRLDQMNCASTTFWLHSANPQNNDSSVLLNFHRRLPASEQTVKFNFLPSYIRSGGNLLLCGIQPVQAMRYFDEVEGGPQFQLDFPIDFCSTLDDPSLVPHWAPENLGICSIENSISQGPGRPVLSLASSQITGGPHPYPDLPFDPLSIPNGGIEGGFRYFDTGIEPTSDAEVIYKDAATGEAVGIRKLVAPGLNGNTIYLGFHPYFIQKSAFRNFLRAAMADFGERSFPVKHEIAID
jgi:hypothetical protein